MELVALNPSDCSSLSLDWNSWAALERVDPYFVWADLTRRAGIVGIGQQPTGFGIPTRHGLDEHNHVRLISPGKVRVLLERKDRGTALDTDYSSEPAGLTLNPLYPNTSKFCTAELAWDNCHAHLYQHALRCTGIERYEGFDLAVAVDFLRGFRNFDPQIADANREEADSSPIPPHWPVGEEPQISMLPIHSLQELIDVKRQGSVPLYISKTSDIRPTWWLSAGERTVDTRLPARLGGNVIAIIDHGCAFANAKFLDKAQQSRVRYLWDQDESRSTYVGHGTPNEDPQPSPDAPKRKQRWQKVRVAASGDAANVLYGAELTAVEIAELMADHRDPITGAVDEHGCYEDLLYDSLRYSSSHGGHVMDIAAGWPNPLQPEALTKDIAGDASIIFVQLPRAAIADTSGGSMSAFVLDALQYIFDRTMPSANIVVNLSYGTYAGPHDGSSRFERAIASQIEQGEARAKGGGGRFHIVAAAGNAFQANCHASLSLSSKRKSGKFQFHLNPDCRVDTFVEFWHTGAVPTTMRIKPPGAGEFLEEIQSCRAVCWGAPAAAAHAPQPVVTVVRVDKATDTACDARPAGYSNHVTLVAIAPTRITRLNSGAIEPLTDGDTNPTPLPPGVERLLPATQFIAAPAGVWEVEFNSTSDQSVTINAWIERDDLTFGDLRKSQQAQFLAPLQSDDRNDFPRDQPTTKVATLSSIATAKGIIVVGGAAINPVPWKVGELIGPHATLSNETSAGTGVADGYGAARVPDLVAPSDENVALRGLRAAGNIGTSTARRGGTSVSAPVVARLLLQHSLAEVRQIVGHVPATSEIDELRGATLAHRPKK